MLILFSKVACTGNFAFHEFNPSPIADGENGISLYELCNQLHQSGLAPTTGGAISKKAGY